jgi:hypothetical protein
MSSGSSIVICMVAPPSCRLSQEQLSSATRASVSSTASRPKARYAQVPGFSAPAVPTLRGGHAIVLPSERNASRVRRTFEAQDRPFRETE